jgi:hypothetical protein
MDMHSLSELKAPRGAIWAADVVVKLADLLGAGIDFIADQFAEVKPLDQAETAQDVINYANSIKDRDPSFAQDLIAAANRSEDGL